MTDPNREELERPQTMTTEELRAWFEGAGDPDAPADPDAAPAPAPQQPEAATNKGGGKIK